MLDNFGNNRQAVTFITAQKKSWYFPYRQNANLTNANGLNYVTYVFKDSTYPGDHNSFTQSAQLVNYSNYLQWYIGASGNIANSQLQDFNDKVPTGSTRSAVLFRLRYNSDLDQDIANRLAEAIKLGDENRISKLTQAQIQRRSIYGPHWDNQGNPLLNSSDFPRLNLEFVST